MKTLDADQTQRVLPFAELVPAIARAARELARGALHSPERLVVPVGGGTLLCMPAAAEDIGITKLVTVHKANSTRGLPVIQGEVVVLEADTGRRLLMLDGAMVTARRTAAVTMLGIDTLAHRKPESVMLIGTGVQAWMHALALIEYLGVRRFKIVGRELSRANKFVTKLRALVPDVDAAAMAADALPSTGTGEDVVIALTTSTTPVVPTELPDTTLVIGVGAFRPEMAELPPRLLRQRRIVVDYLHGARSEAGDLLQAQVDWSGVSEISAVLDATPASHSAAPVFKTVGHASWDLAAARVARQQCERSS